MRKNILILVTIAFRLLSSLCFAASWGDLGNGRYANPVLNADYSDPDVIRVGDKYYMVCSDFHFIGMPVLESTDMVNWKIISQVYDSFDYPGWDEMKRYAGGSWAPAIRHHDGFYYIYFCTPDEGLFMTTATDPHGPWSKLHLLKEVKKWEDPCPFWDEDGNAYLVRSQYGAGPIILHRMSADGKELLDEGTVIYEGPVAEGPKMHKMDGIYYISLPEGGVRGGWQTMLRSDSIYGPYDRKVVLETGSTSINGPHQGAIVDTPDGEWWFYHFQEVPPLGRVVHLQPMTWKDSWPLIGIDYDGNGVGEPVAQWRKPIPGHEPSYPQSSDSFDGATLGLQWQANHRFIHENIYFDRKKGWLSLTASKGDSLRNAPNTLVQKMMGEHGRVTVKLDFSDMKNGQKAGLACLAKKHKGLGVMIDDNHPMLYIEDCGKDTEIVQLDGNEVHLRVDLDAEENAHKFSYSTDGICYREVGIPFEMIWGSWKGPRIGIYSYSPVDDAGIAYFDDFIYELLPSGTSVN
ncbi:MAG: glycoside hydrolase 43 family protein [Muribaculaceae bacterium]|nr:glycoside hydrolase 43 family protein [Muribaculaceae bacterium]